MGDSKLKLEEWRRGLFLATGAASKTVITDWMQAKRMNPKPMITPDIMQMPLHALVGCSLVEWRLT